MNDLNSLLIEGEVVGNRLILPADDEGIRRRLNISSRRHVRVPNTSISFRTETIEISGICRGELAKHVADVKPGRKVRFVGRLAQYGSMLCIEVEHIELRPMQSDKSDRKTL